MSAEQIGILVLAALVGLGSLTASIVAWRRLASVSRGLKIVDVRTQQLVETVPARLVDARTRLAEADAQVERALWALESIDARLDRVTADVIAKRAASDTLRVRLIAGQLSITRLRELVRLAVRLSELRRAFL